MDKRAHQRLSPANVAIALLILLLVLNVARALAQSAPPQLDASLASSGPAISCRTSPPANAADPSTTSSASARFVAGEHFVEDIGGAAAVRILWIGATFRQRFAVKVEERRDETTLRPFDLRGPLSSRDIVARLGEDAADSLGDIWCLLTQQPAGEVGVLAIGGVPNLFYMRDEAGAMHVIDLIWGGAGWEIGASSLDRSTAWPVRSRIFVR